MKGEINEKIIKEICQYCTGSNGVSYNSLQPIEKDSYFPMQKV